MVAISLYRGNLHRVPDVPRQWLMPNHTISLKDFRSLVRKREKTLSRLLSTTTSNPSSGQKQDEFVGDNGCSKPIQPPQTQTPTNCVSNENKITIQRVDEDALQRHRTAGDAKDQSALEVDPKRIGDSFSTPDTKSGIPENNCDVRGDGNGGGGGGSEKQQLTVEISKDLDLLSDKEKRRRDVEQNLKVLNERKHNLVQMLKQILNAEEEIKRRTSVQASVVRPPVFPQQVEVTTDLGPIPRQAVNRTGPDANGGDLEGESENVPNHNTHSRQVHQMRSTSPSASSPFRRPSPSSLQHTAVPHTNRPSLGVSSHTQTPASMLAGVASSPSRFATPSGHQGYSANLPPLSVSGTHYSASSPSPAASGGTSVFRDHRMTSPSWN